MSDPDPARYEQGMHPDIVQHRAEIQQEDLSSTARRETIGDLLLLAALPHREKRVLHLGWEAVQLDPFLDPIPAQCTAGSLLTVYRKTSEPA